MAERRMFAKTIVDSDAFLDMPISTQALYFHLSMRADDDGFVNSPRKIQKIIGVADDDLKLLIAKKFILVFESGVIVIKHWKIHNCIQKDRYNPTKYTEEKSMLLTDENKSYTRASDVPVYSLETQVRLGKDSIDKNNIDTPEVENVFSEIPLELVDSVKAFIEHRKKLKKPMTDHAIKLLVKKTNELANGDINKCVYLLDCAIEHGWLTVYELKDAKQNGKSIPNGDEWEQYSGRKITHD